MGMTASRVRRDDYRHGDSLVGVGGGHRVLEGNRPEVGGASRILIGYARRSTEWQDLAPQRHTPRELGVSDDRVYLDHGLTRRSRARPGLEQALGGSQTW
jgi:hypothetical protein